MDWKCSKNRSCAKTICRTSSSAESFAMLHFSHCKKENLVVSMMRVRQYAYFVEKISLYSMEFSYTGFRQKNPVFFGKKSFLLSTPFFLWESIPFFYGKTPFILWKCSLFSMKISLYSMEKLSHPACSKGSQLRKRYLKLLLKDF